MLIIHAYQYPGVLEISRDIIVTLVSHGPGPLTLPGWSTFWHCKPSNDGPFLLLSDRGQQQQQQASKTCSFFSPALGTLRNRGSATPPPQKTRTFPQDICCHHLVKIRIFKSALMHNPKGSGGRAGSSNHHQPTSSSCQFLLKWDFPPSSSSLHFAGNCRWLYIFIEAKESSLRMKQFTMQIEACGGMDASHS